MMSAMRFRALIVALLMLGSAGAAIVGRPTKHMADEVGMPNLEAMFPKAFGGWTVDTNMPVILPSPDVQALLDKIYNQVLSRTYVNAQGNRIMLSVAYGGDQSDGTSAHRPEVCYPAQGFAITSNVASTETFGEKQILTRRLMSQLGERYEPIIYWIVVGNETVTTGIGQKVAQMKYGLKGVIADGMLVRVSSINKNAQLAYDLQRQFLKELHAAIPIESRKRVFGD